MGFIFHLNSSKLQFQFGRGIQFNQMPPKAPIPLSSIFEYYATGTALKRPKEEIIAELKDLSCICQFLQDRIPSVMKSLRDSAKSHQKGIKDLSTNINQSLRMVLKDKKQDESFSIQAAYDQFSHFSHNKLVDNDYVEKTLAEKQMKLKFLESENLPEDFIWEKPTSKGRDRKPVKDYTWHCYFNTKYHMLEIPTKKYKILITLAVVNSSYVWTIDRIILKASQQNVFFMMKYFDQKIKPAIRAKYPNAYEQNMLACINRYSYYLQLMDLNVIMCQLAGSTFFSEEMTVKHQGKDYLVIFSSPQKLEDAFVSINQVDRPKIVVKLWFMKKQIICLLEIQDSILNAQQFKYENCKSLLSLAEQLIEYSVRVNIFFGNDDPSNFLQNLFIKLAGMYWFWGDNQLDKNSCTLVNQNGVYIGKLVQDKLVYSSIQQDGSLFSPRINRAFLTKLVREVDFHIFFYFLYIIERLLMQNSQRETELDHYYIGEREKEKKVILYFKKKSSIEEHMLKSHSKPQITEDESFNVVKFIAEFTLNFQQLNFYNFRDPEQKTLYEKEQWRPFLNPGNSSLLQIPKVIQLIQYLQENMIFQFVIQKKMKSDSKPLYSIKI